MAFWRRLARRLLGFLRQDHAERELERELLSHVAIVEDDFRLRGMTPTEARAAARRATGGLEQAKELHRDARSFVWLDDLRRDFRYTLRGLGRYPGFTVVVVLTLAFGIGANTAVFSIVNAVLLKPLPYTHSDQLVQLLINLPAAQSPSGAPLRAPLPFTAAEIETFRSQTHSFSHVAMAGQYTLGLSGYDDAARLNGAQVSSGVFDMLEIRALLGRTFGAGDEAPGAEPVIVISAGAWQRYFARDPAIIGRALTLDSVLGPRRQMRYTVVGVLPDVAFPQADTQFWMPPQQMPAGRPPRYPMVARLRDDVSVEAAAAETASLAREMRKGQRGNDVATYELVRAQDELVAPIKPALVVLMTAVGFVLLVTCANVANLLIARSAVRQRETGIRAAIGASRGKLIRQGLTESLTLALLGGTVGIALAQGGLRLLRHLATTVPRLDLPSGVGLPRLEEIGLDHRVLLFTLAASVVTGIAFGLAPALRVVRLDAVKALKDDHGGRVNHGYLSATRSVLVIAQVALATVVLVGGGLLMRSFLKLATIDPGYSADRVLTFQVTLPLSRYPDPRLRTFAEDLVDRLRSIPGVRAAAYANQLPMVQLRDTAGGVWKTPDPQRPPSPSGPDARFVSHDYLTAMGIRVVAGRGFLASDGAGAPRVLLLNETLARQQFPGQNAIGQSLFVARDPAPWTVVGIVQDVRQFGLDREPEAQFFADIRQVPPGLPLFPVGAYYSVRTTGNAEAMLPELRRIVRAIDAEAALFNVVPMRDIVAATISRPRVYAVFLSIFAGIGVFVAALGVYGVMAFTVAQRTREIGIRMALGARRATVLGAVLRQSMMLAGIGVGLGAFGAAGATRYLRSFLFGLTPLDPTTFTAVALLFLAIAALASVVPARRAANVDPLVALRSE